MRAKLEEDEPSIIEGQAVLRARDDLDDLLVLELLYKD